MAEASNVDKILKDNFEEATIEVVQIDYQQLRKVAIQYVQKLIKLEQNIENVKKKVAAISNTATPGTMMQNFALEMSRNDQFVREIFKENFIFRQALDNFLGREIIFTLVNQDGTVLALTKQQQQQLYTKYLSHNTAGRGRMTDVVTAIKNLDFVQSELSQQLNKRLDNYKMIFSEAVRRASKPEQEMRYSPSARTFYYRLFDYHISGWSSQVSNADISELYVDTILNNDFIDNSTQFILAYMANSSKSGHNWVRAIQKGDVTINNTGTGNIDISLALKYGEDFQTQGIRQYILAAFNISLIEDISKDQLSSILTRLSNMYSPKTVKKVVQGAGGKVIQSLQTYTSSIPAILNIKIEY